MAPKTRASSSASQATTSSQPEPLRPTRSSARQRRLSDASNVSDAALTSQSKTPAKRPRAQGKPKAQAPAQSEVIVEEEEEEEVTMEARAAIPHCDGLDKAPTQGQLSADEAIPVSQPAMKQVHFTGDLTENDAMELSAATNITPHIRKMAIKRRRSDSPSTDASVKRVKSSRTSLPPTLSVNRPTQIIQEHSFAPLRVVLQERIRHFSGLKNANPLLGAHAQLDGASDAFGDDMLVLDTHEEFSVAQLPATPRTPVSKGTETKPPVTPGAYDRAQWATERSQFHDAIIALQKEADEATTQVRILNIELESLGLAARGTSPLNILQSIRNSFAQAREFLETDLLGSLPADTTNEGLVEILVTSVQDFAERLRNADKELGEKDQLVSDLVQQTKGILDQLAIKEVENIEVHERAHTMAEDVKKKENDVAHLDLALDKAAEDYAGLQMQRDSETARAEEILTEKTQLESNLSRLSTSLLEYQDEAARLTNRINTMEEEHRATVTAMNKEREETVRDLEDRLDDVTMRHEKLTTDHQAYSDMIQELELTRASARSERDTAQKELDNANAELAAEMERSGTAMAELEEKNAEIEDLEVRLEHLDAELVQYTGELEELRRLNQTERTQREAAEVEIDSQDARIDELNERLQDQGKLANELRQKLFEVQTKSTAKVEELQQFASERDLQFQEDMAVEVSRRESAELLAQERQDTITGLEQQLQDIEGDVRQTLAERDEQLETLEESLAQQDAEAQNLRDNLRTAEDAYASESRATQDRIGDMEGEVKALLDMIAKHEATAADLQDQATKLADEHAVHVEERDAKIAILDNELAGLKVYRSDLEKDKAGLEQRVQEEAEFLLVFQNEKNAEVEELKRTIRDKQIKIQTVEDRVRETDHRWQDLLAARDGEIATLAAARESQAIAIDTLKLKFGDYARRASGFIARLQDQVDAAKLYVDDEGEGLQIEGEELMQEFHGTAIAGMSAKKGKGTKKRQVDSGIGMASPEGIIS